MPSETEEQDRIWMAFPTGGYTLGDSTEAAHCARKTWASVANAAVGFEPVTMLVDPSDVGIARRYLNPAIEVLTADLNDAWMRDIGPTFVLDNRGHLGAVDWVFNGWGAQEWASWDKDALIAGEIAGRSGAQHVVSRLVNEGGGIQVDGQGTVLVTETVQLDPDRNPGWNKAEVETELARTIGATHVIWLPRGLTRDSKRFGTRGHVDIVAAIPAPGKLLVHSQENPEHPDFEVSQEILEFLHTTRDSAGRKWDITEVPAPAVLTDDEGFVDYSYINHLVVNGGVIACSFDDAMDEKALRILANAYPGRRLISVDARELFARGGGIHCITQQQPAAFQKGLS
jgi:agmatine deiminase